MRLAFVANHQGDATAAAAAAGFKHPNTVACRLMRDPKVLEALRLKQDTIIKKVGVQQAKGVTITRNDIINRLDKISQQAESESVRVSALGHLKDIFGLSPKNADTDLFAGWTDEELEHYRATGQLPDRFGVVSNKAEALQDGILP